MFDDIGSLFPTKNMKRRERRHNKFSVIEKAKQVFKHIYKYKDKNLLEQHAKKHADNMQKCDCMLCQNPRKFNHVTLDEMVAKDQMRDGLDDYYEDYELYKKNKR